MVDFYSFHTVLWKHYFRFLCLCIQRSATVFLQNAITALQLFLSILVKRSRSPKVRLYICDLCYWYQSVSICSKWSRYYKVNCEIIRPVQISSLNWLMLCRVKRHWCVSCRQNLLSGYLLRKFKSGSGWQKLWVVFTNFCLFFYKSHQVQTSPSSVFISNLLCDI